MKIGIETHRAATLREIAGEAAAFILFYLGTFLFLCMSGGAADWEWTAGLPGLLLLLGCILTGRNGKYGKLPGILRAVIGGMSVVFLLLLVLGKTQVYQGALLTWNHVLERYGRLTGRFQAVYEVQAEEAAWVFARGCFFLFLGIFQAGICEVVRLSRGRSFAAVTGSIFIILPLFVRKEKIIIGVLLLYPALLLFHIFFGGRRKHQRAGSGRSLADLQNIGVIALLLVLTLVPAMIPGGSGIFRTGFMKPVRNYLTSAVETFRYGKDYTDSMPEGDFRKLGNLELKEETALKVIMERPSSLYLRGFVGSVYTEDGWKEADRDRIYDTRDLFYWLRQDQFSGLTQLSHLYGMEHPGDTDMGTMVVENVGTSRKYCFTPYELTSLPEEISHAYSFGDVNVRGGGLSPKNAYRYQTHTNLVKSYPQIASEYYRKQEAFVKYRKDENSYNAFVYENFLEAPDSLKQLMGRILGEENLGNPVHIPYEKANTLITGYLNKNIRYTEDISECKKDGDFAALFLEVNRKGYSIHYATAAALMYRSLGIPARYVEGYLITPEMAGRADAYAELAVTGKEAHAWVEIYQDGIGWVPMEVTPPYLDKMERPEFEIASYIGGNGGEGENGADTPDQILDEEDTKPETQKGKKEIPVLKILSFIFLGGLLLCLLAWGLYIVCRRRELAERKRSLETADRHQAACRNYAWLMRWLYYDGLTKAGGSRYERREELTEKYGEKFAKDYMTAVGIAEKAAYSSHEISEEQILFLKNLWRTAQEMILEKKKIFQKLKMRLWDFLY